MTLGFNLVDRPWLQCIRNDGRAVELGLGEALTQAHALRELAGDTPLETAALHRLLLAVLHRLFGPASHGEWSELWCAGGLDRERLSGYLDRWRHRFDLFAPQRPFYQAADERVAPKAANSLVQDLAFGNKGTLFDHHTDEEGVALSAAKAARSLVTLQAFGLAGLSGLPAKFTDGPCTRGVIFLVQGSTLFETLLLNMVRYPTDEAVLLHHERDLPAWEMEDPYQPARSRPVGYLDYLTWQSRRILLVGELGSHGAVVRTMSIAPGLRLDAEIADPMKHYRKDRQRGLMVERFSEERALWRDSAALFKLRQDDYRPPRALAWLFELVDEQYLDPACTRRLMALGMANNKARVDFYRDERMPLPLTYLVDDTKVERLDEALGLAERVRGQLWGAARTLARLVLDPEADLQQGREPAPEDVSALTSQWAMEHDYWSQLEIPFRYLVEAIPAGTDAALAGWQQTVRRTAWDAFDRVARSLEFSVRSLKAAVCAREQLAAGLAGLLPKS